MNKAGLKQTGKWMLRGPRTGEYVELHVVTYQFKLVDQ